ncbi:hypothetical protein RJT34_29364 [Clitoria ternatea]|uniref:S-protein homolog n=1 Tax=Clitoria ternatea TaxID=43366 RepID=A0AAN9FF98_CLITE
MRTTIHTSLLLLLLLLFGSCFNGSTFADSLSSSQPDHFHKPNINDSKINILVLTIANDLPTGSGQLHVVTNNFGQFYLEQGKPFIKLSNFNVQSCAMSWKQLSVIFDLYSPSRDGGHQRVYWSVRQDGVYLSYDNVKFDKYAMWGPT